jgi:hypothetical protein
LLSEMDSTEWAGPAGGVGESKFGANTYRQRLATTIKMGEIPDGTGRVAEAVEIPQKSRPGGRPVEIFDA